MDSHEGGAARLLGRRCPRALSFSIDKILQPDFGCQRNGHVLPRVRAGFFNRSTGFHSAAWSSLSGDNPTKEGGNPIADDLFHSIRGLLDAEEVTFSCPGIFDFNGYFEKEKTEKLTPTVLEQNSIYFSTPKFLIQSNDCPKESKKLDNSWSPNSQHMCTDPELSFTPTKPGDFVLAQAWSFSNADSVLPSSSPPSNSRKTFSPCEKEIESLIVPKFDGVNNSLVADVDLQEAKKAVTANSCKDKIAVCPETTIKHSTQPKNNSLADDVTSSTDTSPIRRPKEPKLKPPEIFLANVNNQDSASSTNFEKMQLAGRTVDLKVPLCAPSNSSTAVAINTKTETEAKRGEGSSNYNFPAWLYCTRYSDRPSSGPRCRRKKKHQIDGDEKRSRTAFSSAQLARLRQEFQSNRYLTEKRRTTLAKELDLSESQVKIWFQNKRAKLKKAAGRKNPLALQLMAQGLYNHSSQK